MKNFAPPVILLAALLACASNASAKDKEPIVWHTATVISQRIGEMQQAGAAAAQVGPVYGDVAVWQQKNYVTVEDEQYRYDWIETTSIGVIILPVNGKVAVRLTIAGGFSSIPVS
jgi:hypothetical protein